MGIQQKESLNIREFFDSLPGDHPKYKYISFEILQKLADRLIIDSLHRGQTQVLNTMEDILGKAVM